LTRHLGSTIFDFTIFSKTQEITEINTKSRQNAYEMHKFMNSCILMQKTGKTTKLSQKADFWSNLHGLCIPRQRQK